MEKIQEINLIEIRPSAMNPRKTFDEESLQELADNIKRQGLLQPITVRPVDNLLNYDGSVSSYEVVCGERRYRAVKRNGSVTIPCIVRELTDDEAFDAMITENLQRKDVDPTEEAFAFGELAKRGQTTEEIALRFGKSQRFVLDRIKLNKLIPELMLLVKDGKMAIGAAMLICKLDEELQQRFYKSNKDWNINKSVAERFCNSVFSYISHSKWVKDNRPDYEGGCGKACSQCEFNTQNVGCIFYEMNAEDSTARCIDSERFKNKKMAYLLDTILEQGDVIVKEGGSLETGKTAVIVEARYGTQGDKDDVDKFVKTVKSNGYAVFNQEDVFDTYSYYSEDDERLQQKLANHEVYRCIVISAYYSGLGLSVRYYNFKKDLAGVDSETIAEGAAVAKLAEKYKKAYDKCREHRSTAYRDLFHWDVDNLNGDPLSEKEMNVLAAYMLKAANWQMRDKTLGNGVMPPDDVAYEYVKKHPDKVNLIIRNYLFEQCNEYNSGCATQRDIATIWFPGERDKIEADYEAELEKKCSKLAKELDDMGYTVEGKKKPEKKSRKSKK